MVRIVPNAEDRTEQSASPPASRAVSWTEAGRRPTRRIRTGLAHVDRVLGGGIPEGSIILLTGDPGSGKSTLALQAAGHIAKKHRVLYVSAEEPRQRIAERGQRLGIKRSAQLQVLKSHNMADVLDAVAAGEPALVVLDSIQRLYAMRGTGDLGGPNQVAAVAAELRELVELPSAGGMSILAISQAAKDGTFAGPNTLRHESDANLRLECEEGERFRFLRCEKNRDGDSAEVGVLEMTAAGLRDVSDASSVFLAGRQSNVAGSVVGAVADGSMAVLFELQSLLHANTGPMSKRSARGLPRAIVDDVATILSRATDLNFAELAIRVGICAGGVTQDVGIGLAVAISLASSVLCEPLPADVVVFGEIGLAGDVRPVPRTRERLAEAARAGFRRAIVPTGATGAQEAPPGLSIISLARVDEIPDLITQLKPRALTQRARRK